MSFSNERGNLNMGPIRHGVVYKGKFFEFNSAEYKALMVVEGTKSENKDTALGLVSESEISAGNVIDKN